MEIAYKYLSQIIAANPNVDPTKLLSVMADRVEEYRRQAVGPLSQSLDHRLGVVEGFHIAMAESLAEKPAEIMDQVKCKKGCAHCCRIRVYVSLAEAQYILYFCKEHNIDIDVAYLAEQAKMKEDHEYTFSPHRKCLFLAKDETCSVYTARPLSCRRYFVVSDPKNCDVQGDTKEVLSVATLNEDLMCAGLLGADSDSGSLPEMLLKAIKLDTEL